MLLLVVINMKVYLEMIIIDEYQSVQPEVFFHDTKRCIMFLKLVRRTLLLRRD